MSQAAHTLEPAAKVLWNMGVSDQPTSSDTRARALPWSDILQIAGSFVVSEKSETSLSAC
jgi:hypothetical protein